MKKLLTALFMSIHLQAHFILPHEADENIGPVKTCVDNFIERGGTLIRLEKNEILILKPGDIVFPSCSGANNRSQTLWVLLKQFTDIMLMNPHATRFGFDPVYGKPNWKGTVHKHKDDQFFEWAGFNKSDKFGWNQFLEWQEQDSASDELLKEMKTYYDRNYYGYKTSPTQRRVYITFQKNAHIHLHRLLETNDTLDNVIVAFYPLEDLINKPLKEWSTAPRSVKAYEELTKLLAPYIAYEK
ncbi:MAG: hypothetical protein ACK4HV_06600 [Parachlamydiaceae bacterium]